MAKRPRRRPVPRLSPKDKLECVVLVAAVIGHKQRYPGYRIVLSRSRVEQLNKDGMIVRPV